MLVKKIFGVVMLAMLIGGGVQSGNPRPLANPGPLTPGEELKSFQVATGFHIELAASEPMIIDPVAMAEDFAGRLFVAEMIGYPNGGIGTGEIRSGRIKLLVDSDQDGKYDRSEIFASGLRFPMGVMPWKKGLLVANAPDLLYLEDADGDGKAEKSTVLYTGFNTANIQQMLNSFRWGLDNQVYCMTGSNGGTIVSKENPGSLPVELRGRAIRFRPDQPGSLDPATGGGQYGLTMDSYGHWFVNTNSQHLRHLVLPDAELRRNPSLAVGSMALDIPEHGASCKVFRTSPFEAWRVERTNRRKGGADAKRFVPTELVPGGFSTSSCSPLLLDSQSFPVGVRDSILICEPANNAILRDVLEPRGITFVSRRGDPDKEFLTSSDNWFRPVCLHLCLDGSVLVLDFYREVIETPLSLPEDMKAILPLNSQARGRIWRIKPDGFTPMKPFPPGGDGAALVAELASGNQSRRVLAQQLLVEGKQVGQKEALEKLTGNLEAPLGRLHALCSLEGLGLLGETAILKGLEDPVVGVREHAVRLARPFMNKSEAIRSRVIALVEDKSMLVRCQVAFALGEVESTQAVNPLRRLAILDGADRWMQTAILSSCYRHGNALLMTFLKDPSFSMKKDIALATFLSRLATSSSQTSDRKGAFELIDTVLDSDLPDTVRGSLVEGVLGALVSRSGGAQGIWGQAQPAEQKTLDKIRKMFQKARDNSLNSQVPLANRQAALRVLASGPPELLLEVARQLLTPAIPPALQASTLQALNQGPDGEVAGLLLDRWDEFSPGLRREAVETLFSSKGRFPKILEALEKGIIRQGQLDLERLARLQAGLDNAMKGRLEKAVKKVDNLSRAKVLADYQEALTREGDVVRGKDLFRKQCSACHKLDGLGHQVGPELLAAIRGKGKDYMLASILDPSKEVDTRYVNYLVETRQGRTISGILAAESGTSLTLRRGEGAEDTLLRNQIESVVSTNKSLMPEGFEAQISKKDMADLLTYLLKAANNP